jgi:hypothetical protein
LIEYIVYIAKVINAKKEEEKQITDNKNLDLLGL